MNASPYPDRTDISMLDALQQDIPLVPDPWKEMAARLGIPETEFLQRLERLRRDGILRGVSPIIESLAVGLAAATLVALPVSEDRMHEVAGIVSTYPEVSHNFRRDHRYSLWFTLSAADDAALDAVLFEILQRTGFSADEILNLPTVRKIKINVRFLLRGHSSGGHHGRM